ncbi:MAG TPA: hypothetical protein PKC76_09670 [Saprospiraceae bacterium]|nr:hypothetical protein [Saprospiraceae bacterium]HMP24389.1 hypothetical protein [Saprospiraceae bacterium]
MKAFSIQILFLLTVLAVVSCNKKNRSDGEVGTPFDKNAPTIRINNEESLRDTFKFGIDNLYTFQFSIKDDQTARLLSASKLDNGLVLYKGNILNNTSVDITGVEQGELQFRALKAGFFSFAVKVTDPQGLSSFVLVELNALENKLPVPVLELIQTDAVAPGQVRISADKSFDADARWGGKIMKYEYDIEGFYKTETVRNTIDFIFPQAGTYRVSLRVMDNDQAWSAPISRQITVE